MAIRKRSTKIAVTTEFLAIDIEIVSHRRLDDLIWALGSEFDVNRNQQVGRTYVVLLSTGGFVPAQVGPERYANRLIRRVAKRVQKLSGDAKDLWTRARTKTFDIGFQAGRKPPVTEILLERETVDVIARIGAGVKITIYGAEHRKKPG